YTGWGTNWAEAEPAGHCPSRERSESWLWDILKMMERTEGISIVGSLPSQRLAELYERHVGPAVALAALVGGDADAAEDIAHEAFIRTAGRLSGLRDPSAFDAYLRRTVVNLCRARARRGPVRPRVLRGGRPP